MSRKGTYVLKLWAALALPIGLAACISQPDSAVADVNPLGWDEPLELTYANTDTTAVRTAALILRYDSSYTADDNAAGGMYIVEARSPSGAKTRDTLQIGLRTDRKFNNIRETIIPYRRRVVLAEQGEYTFTITPPYGTLGVWNTGIDLKNRP